MNIKISKKFATLIFVFLVILSPCFYDIFETNNELLQDYNKMVYHWENLTEWINEYTTTNDRFLTTNNPRQWAWFIDRQVFQLAKFDGGVQISFDEITGKDLILLIEKFNITYFIVDESISINPELSYLFDFSETKFLPIFSSDANQIDISKIMLEKIIFSQNNSTILYRVEKDPKTISINHIREMNATFEQTGNVSITDNGEINIITGPTKGVTYLTTKFQPAIAINNTLLVVYVKNSTNSVGGALKLKFKNKEFFFSYLSPGLYFYPLDSMIANNQLQELALYASLRQGEGYFTVSYLAVCFISLQ